MVRFIKASNYYIFGFYALIMLLCIKPVHAQDTVKIMSWNLLNYTVGESDRNAYYRTVIGSVDPDIFVCQEVADGQAAVDSFYKNVIQQITPALVKGSFINGADTDNAIFYDPAIFTFISNTAIVTALRDINEFKLLKNGSGDTLRIYSVHLKASSGSSNEILRAKEVDSLRKVTNVLLTGSNFLVCGDFNLYSSNESAYQKLIQDNVGDDGHFIDPITMPSPSNWNNSANAAYHTQSPRIRQFGGGSTGGMDDRFDLMLFSSAITNSGGMYYIPGSFVAYGNDGNHYNDSINSLPNTAVSVDVANGIHYASDHLPIYAKFTFPSMVTAPTAQPTNLQFGNVNASSFTSSFTPASPAPAGYLVVRKAGSTPTGVPVNGTAYTAGNSLGDGVVVYSGSGNSFSNTSLTAGTTYYFKVFSFNGSGTGTLYLTTSPLTGSQATTSAAAQLTVNTSLLNFGNTLVANTSAVQNFTVSGINLSTAITITPPNGFQVSTNNSTGFISYPSSLQISPVSGTVTSTTIYVRFSPSLANGDNGDSITVSSTGASTSKVPVQGKALATEPTTTSGISIIGEYNGLLHVGFTGGNGSKRVLFIRSGATVSYIPTDGTAVSGVDSNVVIASDLGSGNKAVYDGSGNSVFISGLTGGTQYYFAVYDYSVGTGASQNYLQASTGTANYTMSLNYQWIGGNGSFTTAANWSPARSSVSAADILLFNSSDSIRVTGLTAQSIGKLIVSNNTSLTLSATAACSLTIAGAADTDFVVEAGSRLHLRGTAAISLVLSSGVTGSISGVVSADSSTHKIFSNSAGAMVFNNGASFLSGSPNSGGFSGNPFGNVVAGSVIFSAGSEYIFYSGSNPFVQNYPNSITVFQAGSWFRIGRAGILPSYSGKVYANIELNLPEYTGSPSGGSAFTFDTLRVKSGIINFTLNGGINIKGALIVETNGTVNFNPSTAAYINFNGTAQQRISGGGNLGFGSTAKILLNNSSGLVLARDVTFKNEVNLQNGVLSVGAYKLTLDSNVTLPATSTAANMFSVSDTGEVRKVFFTNSSFVYPIGSNGVYAPVTVTLISNTGLSNAYIGVRTASLKHINTFAPEDFLNRYWTVTGSGIANPNYTVVGSYELTELSGLESKLYSGFWNGTQWSLGAVVNGSTHQYTYTGATGFGDFTAAHQDFVGNAAVLRANIALQAMYNHVTGNLQSPQTITGQLFNSAAPFSIVDSSSVSLNANTLEALFTFRSLPTGNYFISFKHRNSIKTWLAEARSFSIGKNISLNLTEDSSLIAGTNMVNINGTWCFYSGDVNQDGFVDFSDLTLIDNDAYNFVSGEADTDLNGDEFVDFSDLTICDNNAYNFIGEVLPAGMQNTSNKRQYRKRVEIRPVIGN